MAALVDTNVLVYRFDDRFADKQKIATEILRRGIVEDSVRVPHQAIVAFVAAVTRPTRGHVILKQADALREAEEFLKRFIVLYPNEAIVRLPVELVRRAHLVIRGILRPAGDSHRGSSARSAVWYCASGESVSGVT